MKIKKVDVLRGRTVIICEDEWAMATYLKVIMKKAGMRVIDVVADGKSCVDEVLRKRPDLVLIDINLPADMDGTEAARQIFLTSRVSRPCVVMVTAYTDDEHRQEAQDAGVDGYVVKPYLPNNLVEQIRAAMETNQCVQRAAFPAIDTQPQLINNSAPATEQLR